MAEVVAPVSVGERAGVGDIIPDELTFADDVPLAVPPP